MELHLLPFLHFTEPGLLLLVTGPCFSSSPCLDRSRGQSSMVPTHIMVLVMVVAVSMDSRAPCTLLLYEGNWSQFFCGVVFWTNLLTTRQYFYNIPTRGEESGDDLGELVLSLNSAGETYPALFELCQTSDFRASSLWTGVPIFLVILNL